MKKSTKTRNFLPTKFTAESAQTFERYSESNIFALRKASAEKSCSCEPYVDWFTYRRWDAQGFQVMKGQTGTKIEQMIPFEKEDSDGSKERKFSFKQTSVFCRCQVMAKSEMVGLTFEQAIEKFNARTEAALTEAFQAVEIS